MRTANDWAAFPYDNCAYRRDAAALQPQWALLHAGDAEPWPADAAVVEAWCLFHAGEFEAAHRAGLAAGAAGITVANKAQLVYANYLESREARRLEMFLAVAARAQAQQRQEPRNPNAWYYQASAIGRYGQAIRVAQALAQGLGAKVRGGLETVIALQPRHADAHIALAVFHAEVIDKVGKLLASTQGADAATGLRLFEQALALNPRSVVGMTERAGGLLMLGGERYVKQAEQLYIEAAAVEPLDAMEHLAVQLAREALDD
ncbi:MAG: hypothetical protein ABW005_13705 [Burkholderiaceae bacterium]